MSKLGDYPHRTGEKKTYNLHLLNCKLKCAFCCNTSNNVVSTREAKYAMHTNVFSAAPLGLFADFSDEMEMEMDEHFRAPPPPPAASVATSR